MAEDSNVAIALNFNDPMLDAEERDEEVLKLLSQLKDLDEIETGDRVLEVLRVDDS